MLHRYQINFRFGKTISIHTANGRGYSDFGRMRMESLNASSHLCDGRCLREQRDRIREADPEAFTLGNSFSSMRSQFVVTPRNLPTIDRALGGSGLSKDLGVSYVSRNDARSRLGKAMDARNATHNLNLEGIRVGIKGWSLSDKCGRLSNPWQNVPSKLRNELRCDKESMVSIDRSMSIGTEILDYYYPNRTDNARSIREVIRAAWHNAPKLVEQLIFTCNQNPIAIQSELNKAGIRVSTEQIKFTMGSLFLRYPKIRQVRKEHWCFFMKEEAKKMHAIGFEFLTRSSGPLILIHDEYQVRESDAALMIALFHKHGLKTKAQAPLKKEQTPHTVKTIIKQTSAVASVLDSINNAAPKQRSGRLRGLIRRLIESDRMVV